MQSPAWASSEEVLTAHSALLRVLLLTLVRQFQDPQAALNLFVNEAKNHLDTGQYDPRSVAGAKRYLDHFRSTMAHTPATPLRTGRDTRFPDTF